MERKGRSRQQDVKSWELLRKKVGRKGEKEGQKGLEKQEENGGGEQETGVNNCKKQELNSRRLKEGTYT